MRREGEGVGGGVIEQKNSISLSLSLSFFLALALSRLQPVSVHVQPPQKASNPKAHSGALEKEGNNQDCFHRPPSKGWR